MLSMGTWQVLRVVLWTRILPDAAGLGRGAGGAALRYAPCAALHVPVYTGGRFSEAATAMC